MDMASIIDRIRAKNDCKVLPPSGLPTISDTHTLPDDLRDFYTICGGVTLFESSYYPTVIVPPHSVVLVNPVLFSGVDKDQLLETRDHISWSWYIIAEGDHLQYITIDLSSKRLGHCYDSFWDVQ